MSGGVDSSVAAWLLREAGHEVIGLFMRHGSTVESACSVSKDTPQSGASTNRLPIVTTRSHKQGCCSASDAQDARRVADPLMRQQPHGSAVIGPWRDAADEVGFCVGNHAWQDRNAETRTHGRQESGRRRVMHRHLAFEAEGP